MARRRCGGVGMASQPIAADARDPVAQARHLSVRLAGLDGADFIAGVRAALPDHRHAIVTSFGAESAVLLHMAASVDRALPVIMVDTLKLFPETLEYALELAARLGLTDLRIHTPDPATLAARDATGLRWSYDPDGCCALRKVAPLDEALAGIDVWYSGRKAFQAATRSALPRLEGDGARLKVNPLALWDRARIADYMTSHALPAHPLVAQGYPSIGCAPCTSRVLPGEDPRAGRWRGWDKVECGIHQPASGADEPAF